MAHPPTYICEGVCGRTVRQKHRTLKDYPGTVGVHRNGKCRPCYTRPTGLLPELPHTFPCRGGCGRLMRRKHATKQAYPGTVSAYANDMCSGCYKAYRPAPVISPQTPAKEAASVQNAVASNPALAAFHARMRRAGARHNRKKATT